MSKGCPGRASSATKLHLGLLLLHACLREEEEEDRAKLVLAPASCGEGGWDGLPLLLPTTQATKKPKSYASREEKCTSHRIWRWWRRKGSPTPYWVDALAIGAESFAIAEETNPTAFFKCPHI